MAASVSKVQRERSGGTEINVFHCIEIHGLARLPVIMVILHGQPALRGPPSALERRNATSGLTPLVPCSTRVSVDGVPPSFAASCLPVMPLGCR